jgi:hypothetical protein
MATGLPCAWYITAFYALVPLDDIKHDARIKDRFVTARLGSLTVRGRLEDENFSLWKSEHVTSGENAQLVQVLTRIGDLLELLVRAQLAPVLEKELTDPQMRKLYELTGVLTTSQLVKRMSFSAGKISAVWARWETLGLIRKEGGRYKRVV